jgi:membrane AbrB-like protein
MPPDPSNSTSGRFGERAPASQWTALVVASAAISLLLAWVGVPAALLVGPMIAGIAAGVSGARIEVSHGAFSLAQGVIGCMIARMLPAVLGGDAVTSWPLITISVVWVIAGSAFLGWLLSRSGVLPGTTALWGLSPGGATAMTLMAEGYGADGQLVAFMQYMRVVIVATLASLVAKICGASVHSSSWSLTWFHSVDWVPFAQTLALAFITPIIANRLRLRAGALLMPAVAGILLTHWGWMKIELPPWLLALSYAVIGWRVGLRFTRPLLAHALRAFPRVMMSTLALIALCGALAAVLTLFAGIDPLTSYLATSPGGADTAAIIAASSNVNVHFVMGMQTVRLVAVLILTPPLTRYIARRSQHELR